MEGYKCKARIGEKIKKNETFLGHSGNGCWTPIKPCMQEYNHNTIHLAHAVVLNWGLNPDLWRDWDMKRLNYQVIGLGGPGRMGGSQHLEVSEWIKKPVDLKMHEQNQSKCNVKNMAWFPTYYFKVEKGDRQILCMTVLAAEFLGAWRTEQQKTAILHLELQQLGYLYLAVISIYNTH